MSRTVAGPRHAYNHDEAAAASTHPEGYKPLLSNAVLVLACNGSIIIENRRGFGEGDTVRRLVCLGFRRVPHPVQARVYGHLSSLSTEPVVWRSPTE